MLYQVSGSVSQRLCPPCAVSEHIGVRPAKWYFLRTHVRTYVRSLDTVDHRE